MLLEQQDCRSNGRAEFSFIGTGKKHHYMLMHKKTEFLRLHEIKYNSETHF
jgi:hypothetical protein